MTTREEYLNPLYDMDEALNRADSLLRAHASYSGDGQEISETEKQCAMTLATMIEQEIKKSGESLQAFLKLALKTDVLKPLHLGSEDLSDEIQTADIDLRGYAEMMKHMDWGKININAAENVYARLISDLQEIVYRVTRKFYDLEQEPGTTGPDASGKSSDVIADINQALSKAQTVIELAFQGEDNPDIPKEHLFSITNLALDCVEYASDLYSASAAMERTKEKISASGIKAPDEGECNIALDEMLSFLRLLKTADKGSDACALLGTASSMIAKVVALFAGYERLDNKPKLAA